MDTLVTGIIMGFSLAAPIGPVNIETIKRGFRSGLGSAIVFGVGAIMGDMVYCCLILMGLVPLLTGIPGLERLLWGSGALMMLYLGWGGIRELWQDKEIDLEEGSETPGVLKNFSLGLALAVFNPYALMWHITAGAAYVSGGVSRAGFLGGMASVSSFLVGVFLWLAILIFAIHRAKQLITPTTMRVISALSGAALWCFALWFAYNFVGM